MRPEESFANFITWSVRAIGHKRTGYDEDALINLRKAGEAAAKTIIAHQWPGQRAADAIAGARFADLIHTIIRDRLAPKATILLLQTLQVEGNAGSHDERVRRGRVSLGMAALHELAKWLCSELLGRTMPGELQMAFEERPVQPVAPNLGPTALPAHEERMAGIEAALNELAERTTRPNDAPDPQVIEAINALHARLDALTPIAPAPAAAAVPVEAPVVAKKHRRRWWPIAGVLALLLLGAGMWWGGRSTSATDGTPANKDVIMPKSDALTVLLLPITVVQDDPNLRLDLRAAIAHRLEKRIREYPWAGRVVLDSTTRAVTPTAEDAWTAAVAMNADLVIYGDLLEPTATDSGRIILGHVLHAFDALHTGDLRSAGFRTMADAGVERVLDACVWWYDRALAERSIRHAAFSEALTVLQHAAPPEAAQETMRRMLLAQCFAATGNTQAALREAVWCREQGVAGAGLHAFLTDLFIRLGDRRAALAEAEQAVKKEPGNNGYTMTLADLLVDPNDLASPNNQRSERLVDQVLKSDASNAHAWFAKAVLHNRRGQWNEAIRAYERSLQLEPMNLDSKVQLAHLLAQRSNDPERALYLVNEVIAATDSTHVKALELAGDILTHTQLADPRAATQVLRRVDVLRTDDRADLLLTQGQAALMAGDQARALAVLERCWMLDSGNVRVAEAYALALLRAGRYEQGLRVAQHGLSQDPLDSRLNAHLGELFLIGPASLRDPRKAEQYLSTALRTDMHDPYVLSLCGETRLRLGNVEGAASVIYAAHRLTPNDHRTNRNMGNVKEAQNDLKAAALHYRRAIDAMPDDDQTASNLAYVLLRSGIAQEGLHWSQRSVGLARSPENLVVHAALLLANERRSEAVQTYKEAVADRQDLRQAELERELGLTGR